LEPITLTIDGSKVSCPVGTSILDAAGQQGIKIPTLCHHPDLKPFGACRLCLVEDENSGRLMAACVTPVASNMVIQTATPRIVKHRRNIVRLMISEHPESCIVCSKGNRCQLRQVAARLGIGETDLYPMPNYKPLEQGNPFIMRDLSKCILCGKCIRADHELVVVGAIDYNQRGFASRPATIHEKGLENSNCTFCGTCVSMCPTGALAVQNTRYVGSPEREALSICGFCGVGCSLSLGISAEKIIEVNPADSADSVNRSTLCVRGHFAHDFLMSTDRLVAPLIIKKDENDTTRHVPTSWDEALDRVASRLKKIASDNGPQSIGFLGSSKCTNEENYLLQRMARTLIGTNNVDNGGFLFGRGILDRIDERLDNGGRINPLRDLEKADAIFVLGTDPGHSVPVVSYYLKRQARKGTPVIIADSRRTDISRFADIQLQIKPQTDLELVNALAAKIYSNQGYDPEFIDRNTENFSVYRYSLSSYDLERACRITGLDLLKIEQTASLLHAKKIAFIIGNGLLQQKNGAYTIDAVINLAILSGSIGSKGSGLYIMAKENNLLGAMDLGTIPHRLPGRQPLHDPAARRMWEQAWGVKISPDPGLNMVRMIEAAEKGNLKAMYIMGENPLRSLPQTGRVKRALRNLDFLVVQDILKTETAKLADVILPGAAFSEKEGSFTNMEGRIQTFKQAVSAPGLARADWQIIDDLSLKMGQDKPYGSIENIRKDIREHVPGYANLDDQPSGWLTETSRMAVFGKADAVDPISFSPIVSTENPVEDQEEDFTFTATLGSLRYHLGSGTRSRASARIRSYGVKSAIRISQDDGSHMGLTDSECVRVSSLHGSIERRIRVDDRLTAGQLFIPLAYDANNAMDLLDLTDPSAPDSPGWKTCRVKVEKINSEGNPYATAPS